ncbi:MAG: diguanylate cyclase [Candidatus Limiplasma sp.]|nr:diguanylate cyclase [Candidatus Limiplasma sp.]MEA5146801.1 diguanylate cyclase [Candidatus Limiplasma sp.]
MCVIAYVQMNLFGIIILLFYWLNQRRSGALSLDDRLFNGILIATMLELLMDAGQWALEGAHFPGSYLLQMLCYSLGYGVAPAITCLWAMYCDLRTNMDERSLRRRLPLYLLPAAINTLLLVANVFTPLVFNINADNIYQRDRLFWVYMAFMYFYGLVSLVWVIRKSMHPSDAMERSELRFIALFIVAPLIAGVLQWLFYGISLIWQSVVLSIILVYTNVLSRQISTDPLTGLNNRRKLNRYLSLKIGSAQTTPSMYLIMMDADDFKSINDQYGHTAGDRALVAISDILKQVCSRYDCFLSRLGGDEFVILGHDQDQASTPQTVIRQIEAGLDALNQSQREPFPISLSIGWAKFDTQTITTADALLTAADQQMYRTKVEKHEARRRLAQKSKEHPSKA